MSRIFVTGGNGYLGSYTCAELLRDPQTELALLIRGKSRRACLEKLWATWQLHMDVDTFQAALKRVQLVEGDLHAPGLGIDQTTRHALREDVGSILHIAASLNRKSEKACLNTNLRGTLSVIQLARELHDHGRLNRYSHVSTVAVAGQRSREVVQEDDAVDFDRSDYDPYGRTKKFCEHMAHELLADIPHLIFRPSIVMGDSRFPATTQFDMVRAFCIIADLPIIPLPPDVRLDIENADWVGHAIATIHNKPNPRWRIYHLSAGTGSLTARQIADAMVQGEQTGSRRRARFAGPLDGAFELAIRLMNRAPRGTALSGVGALLKVFWPYITYDTVFANDRAVLESGRAPIPFDQYCHNLYAWSNANQFVFPVKPLPEGIA
jgi:thioester reductase-like protein